MLEADFLNFCTIHNVRATDTTHTNFLSLICISNILSINFGNLDNKEISQNVNGNICWTHGVNTCTMAYVSDQHEFSEYMVGEEIIYSSIIICFIKQLPYMQIISRA